MKMDNWVRGIGRPFDAFYWLGLEKLHQFTQQVKLLTVCSSPYLFFQRRFQIVKNIKIPIFPFSILYVSSQRKLRLDFELLVGWFVGWLVGYPFSVHEVRQ